MDKYKKEKTRELIALIEDNVNRQAKVKRIKRLVKKGNYIIDADKIAEKIVSDALINEYLLFYPIFLYVKQKTNR
ncbi:MAG: flagellar biosynthesis anti-sigma factor FlgM [Candidatus Schekmanbacteria bacterium]|nr:flagellar biosynthesis anti-sigma factor FlgM [Candidatus Schekmanbacteria bacterium]